LVVQDFSPTAPLMRSSDTPYIGADYLPQNTCLYASVTYREHIIVFNAFIFRQRPFEITLSG